MDPPQRLMGGSFSREQEHPFAAGQHDFVIVLNVSSGQKCDENGTPYLRVCLYFKSYSSTSVWTLAITIGKVPRLLKVICVPEKQ